MHFVPTRGEQVPQLMAAVAGWCGDNLVPQGKASTWTRRPQMVGTDRHSKANHRAGGFPLFNCIKKKSEHSEHGGSKGPRLCRRCRVCLRVPQELAIFILNGISLSRMRVAMTRTPGSSGTVNQNISASRCNDLSQNGWELSCLLACYWYGGRGPWPDRLPKPSTAGLSSAPQTFAMLDSPLSCCAAMQFWVISRDAPGPSECRRPARKLRRPALIARFAKNHAGNFQHVAWE